MDISIVIPTYNRKGILKKCLNAIFCQIYSRSAYEIIVVDDGSTDGTEKLVRSMINSSPVALRYFKQEHKGPAAARNVGIKNVDGKIILFIGDDSIAAPNLLEEHLKWHDRYPEENVAVLGYITWSPQIRPTPFMYWLENGGPQFSFSDIKDKVEVDWRYFYTSNASVKKNFLVNNNEFFDEELNWAYEDTELGYRLAKKGMLLKYNKQAIAYHYHYTSLRNACLRMIRIGRFTPLFKKKIQDEYQDNAKYGPFRKVLRRIKFIIYYLIAKFYEKRAIKEAVFNYLMGYCLHIGIERYRKLIK